MESSTSIAASPRILLASVPASIRLAAIPEPDPSAKESPGMLVVESHTLLASREVLTRSVRRLQSPQDARDHSRVVLAFHPATEELTLHHLRVLRDGVARESVAPGAFRPVGQDSTSEPTEDPGRLSLAVQLEDVRPGDLIDLAFTTRNRAPAFEDKSYFGFTLGWPFPVAEAHLTVTLPAGSPLVLRAAGLGSEPRREMCPDGGERLVWQARNPKPIPSDGTIPTWHLCAPHVQGSDFADWNEVAVRVHRLWEPSLRPGAGSAAIQDLAVDLREANESPEAIAQAASCFVQDQVANFGLAAGPLAFHPVDPDRVLARLLGNGAEKALLLCAILRASGLSAWPTLVHSTLQHTIAGFLPSPDAFNHVIVCIRIEKQYFWVDPTLSSQGGSLGSRVLPRFVQGLIVHPQSKGLVKLPKPSPDSGELLVHENFAIDYGAMAARLTTTTTARGTEADSLRQVLARVGREGAEREFLRALRSRNPGAERESPLEIDDDREANHIVLREAFRVPDFVVTDPTSRRKSVCLPGHVIGNRLAESSETKREHPLHLPFPNRILHSIAANVPDDFEIAGTRNTLEGPGFTFSTSVRLNPGKLEIRNAYTATANRVEPADFPLYAGKLHRVREALNTVVPLPLQSIGKKNRTLLGVGAGAVLVAIIGLLISVVMNDGGRNPGDFIPIDDIPDTLSTLDEPPGGDDESFNRFLSQGSLDALDDPGSLDIGGPSLLEAREFDFSLDPGSAGGNINPNLRELEPSLESNATREFNRAEGIPSLIE